jgi:hypothetical protein
VRLATFRPRAIVGAAAHAARMIRRNPSAAAPTAPPRERQLELFPEPVAVDALDPRRTVGERSRVRAVYRVRFATDATPHRVFDDRHGWYCDEHGPACRAVQAARAAAGR